MSDLVNELKAIQAIISPSTVLANDKVVVLNKYLTTRLQQLETQTVPQLTNQYKGE